MENDKNGKMRFIPFCELGLKEEFITIANTLELTTLDQVIHTDLPKLIKKKQFNYVWFAELLHLLKKYELLAEFESRQAKG